MPDNKTVFIGKYIVYYNKETPQRTINTIKRRIRKAGLGSVAVSYVDISNNIDQFHTELKNINNKGKWCDFIGVLNANNILVNPRLISSIPPVPKEFDILCLECDICEYSKNKNDNIYWKGCKVSSSGHFIVNSRHVNSVISSTKNIQNLNLVAYACKNVFCITQYHYSFNSEQSNMIIPTINANFETAKRKHHAFTHNVSKIVDTFYELYNRGETNNKQININRITSDVSFVTILTDHKLFFNTLNTFIKLGLYTSDKTELIVIDDTGSDKKIDNLIAPVSGVKYINITPKNGENEKYPLGYKLNLAVKYSEYSTLCILSDTCIYNLTGLVKCINRINSRSTHVVISKDTVLYNNVSKEVSFAKVPNISCMAFTKDFWYNFSFEQTLDDPVSLIGLWIFFRTKLVDFVPFIDFGFAINKTLLECQCKYCIDEYKTTSMHEFKIIPFNVMNLVHPDIKESVDMILQNSR